MAGNPAGRVVLLVTSVAETYLPGRSAEITDALMVLMIGLVMAAIMKRQDPGHYPAPAPTARNARS